MCSLSDNPNRKGKENENSRCIRIRRHGPRRARPFRGTRSQSRSNRHGRRRRRLRWTVRGRLDRPSRLLLVSGRQLRSTAAPDAASSGAAPVQGMQFRQIRHIECERTKHRESGASFLETTLSAPFKKQAPDDASRNNLGKGSFLARR